MKKNVFLLFLFLSTITVYSASLETAIITYRHLDSLKYEVTVKAYRNCLSTALSASMPLYVTCKGSSIKISRTLILKSIIDVTPICSTATRPCNPSNTYSTGEGTEEHTFVDTVDFNSSVFSGLKNCNEILFEYTYCCRPGTITTGASSTYFYNYAYLNRSFSKGNNSPQIPFVPTQRLCCSQPFFSNVAAIDTSENDSISYSFDNPMESYLKNVSYTGVFDKDLPISCYYPGSLKYPYSNPVANPPIGIYLNQETGDLVFTPVQCNESTVAVVKVTEWRRDSVGNMQIVGIVRQEFLYTVKSCSSNNPPTIYGPYTYNVCAGEKVCFNVTTDDKVYTPPPPAPKPAADTVSIFWNGGIKGASFSVLNSKALLQTGQFCWTTKESDANGLPYQFVVEARDNACPINALTRRAFQVYVNAKVDLNITKKDLSCNAFGYSITTKNSSGLLNYTVKIKDSTNATVTDSRIVQFNSTNTIVSNKAIDTVQFYKKGIYYIEYVANYQNKSCPTLIIDTIVIKDNFANLVDFEDTFFCAGSVLQLTANTKVLNGFKNYKWHTGNAADTLQSVTLNSTASQRQLKFTAEDAQGCTQSDFVIIVQVALPKANLGNDTFICSKKELLFKAPAQPSIAKYNYSYFWNNASTLDSFKTSQPGIISLKVTNVCGSSIDSVLVIATNQLLQAKAPVSFCEGNNLTIQSQLSGYNYQWQTSGLGYKISAVVSAPGNYNCQIILTCGDTLIETIAVIEHKKPVLYLPDTITYCKGNSVAVMPGNWDKYTNILWHDNKQDSVRNISKPGKYIFSAINSCGIFTDSFLAIENPLPKADIGENKLYCHSFSQSYDFSASTDNYLWNDNSQSKTRTITKPGFYWLKVSNQCGVSSDTILLEQSFVPQVNLGKDTAVKLPFSILLDAENRGASFLWNSNDTLRTLLVTKFGTYWVNVTTPCGVAVDSIMFTDAAANVDFNKEGIKIYPNPTTGKLNIFSSLLPIHKVQLLNVLGEEVLVKKINDASNFVTLSLDELVAGIYYLKVHYNDGSFGVYSVIKSQ